MGLVFRPEKRPFSEIRGILRLLVHTAATRNQPFKIQLRIAAGEALDKIVAGFVAASQQMLNAAAGDAQSVGELRLRYIFGCQKLFESGIHIEIIVNTNVTIDFHSSKHNINTGGELVLFCA